MIKSVILCLLIVFSFLMASAQQSRPLTNTSIDSFTALINDASMLFNKSDFRKRYFYVITEVDKQYYTPRNPKTKTKDTIYIDPQALDSGLYKIFSTVVIDNEGLVKNGTAASIEQDKDKATLSFNYSTLSKSRKIVANFGLYGSSTGSLSQFYSAQSWQKNIGLKAGITWILGNNKRSFDGTPARDKLNAQRTIFYGQLRRQYQELFENYSKWLKDSVDSKKILDLATGTARMDQLIDSVSLNIWNPGSTKPVIVHQIKTSFLSHL